MVRSTQYRITLANFSAATDSTSHGSIGFSHTNRPSRNVVALTGGSIGFGHFGGVGTAVFSFGRHNGLYTAEKSTYYTDLLDDAKQIHVVLQDMKQRRAWQTNGESTILQVILHRHAMGTYNVGGRAVNLCKANPGDPSSIRRAMIQNTNIEVAHDQYMKENVVKTKRFRDLVGELYAILEGLEGHSEEVTTAGIKLKTDWRRRITGYEYMELIQKKHKMQVKEAELRKTCGNWPDYARDINAVVLFGTNFGEPLQPRQSVALCRKYRAVPMGKDYLAVEVSSLQSLYSENGSLTDQMQITATGMQWNRSKHLFESCPPIKARGKGNTRDLCHCERIQEFVPKGVFGSVRRPGQLSDHGAVIFGQGTSGWINELTKSLPNIRNATRKQDAASTCQPTSPLPISRQNVEDYGTNSRDWNLRVDSFHHPSPCSIDDMPLGKPARLSTSSSVFGYSDTRLTFLGPSIGRSRHTSVFSADDNSLSMGRHSITATIDSGYTVPENTTSDREQKAPSFIVINPPTESMQSHDISYEFRKKYHDSSPSTISQSFMQRRSAPLPSDNTIDSEPIQCTPLSDRTGSRPMKQADAELLTRPSSFPKPLHSQQGTNVPKRRPPQVQRMQFEPATATSSLDSNSWANADAPCHPILRRKPGFQHSRTSS